MKTQIVYGVKTADGKSFQLFDSVEQAVGEEMGAVEVFMFKPKLLGSFAVKTMTVKVGKTRKPRAPKDEKKADAKAMKALAKK